jgi:hypothetical protein
MDTSTSQSINTLVIFFLYRYIFWLEIPKDSNSERLINSERIVQLKNNSGEGCVVIPPPQGVVNELGLYILDIKIPVLEYNGTVVYTAVLVLE